MYILPPNFLPLNFAIFAVFHSVFVIMEFNNSLAGIKRFLSHVCKQTKNYSRLQKLWFLSDVNADNL